LDLGQILIVLDSDNALAFSAALALKSNKNVFLEKAEANSILISALMLFRES